MFLTSIYYSIVYTVIYSVVCVSWVLAVMWTTRVDLGRLIALIVALIAISRLITQASRSGNLKSVVPGLASRAAPKAQAQHDDWVGSD